MTSLESIEKLRTIARNMAKGRNLENHEECNLLLIAADEIEREIAEKYMPLPADVNGVLIRIGDTVRELDDCVPMKVMSLTFYEDCVDVNAYGMNPNLLLHVKPRTVEDVLRDFLDVKVYTSKTYERYADELRELIKEGEL